MRAALARANPTTPKYLRPVQDEVNEARRDARAMVREAVGACKKERAKVREACAAKVGAARETGALIVDEAIEQRETERAARKVLAKERRERREGERDKKRETSRTLKKWRQTREEAIDNLPIELQDWARAWPRVAARPRMSLTETYLQIAHENPEAVARWQAEHGEREAERLIREQESKHAREELEDRRWRLAKAGRLVDEGGRGRKRVANPRRGKKRETPIEAYRRVHWGERGNGRMKAMRAPDPRAGDLVELGRVVSIVYETIKGGDGEPVEYEHDFGRGRKKSGRPTLAYNATGLFIVGGTYTVTTRGIEG